MDTTSNIINENNIVSSDVSELKLDKSFVAEYGLTNFDQKLVLSAIQSDMGMTAYQASRFVANSQLTPYKKVRQALMELEVRHHAYQEIRASLRRAEIGRLKMFQQMEFIKDPLDKELLQIDIDKNDYDISIWKRKLRQSEYEMKSFIDIVKEHAPDEESLKYYMTINEEEERQYWITRMGKQAALDIIAYGRIGSGNMDSIAMMKSDEQLDTLSLAVQYSGLINAGLHKISVSAQETVDKYLSNNDITIPELLDDKFNPSLQLTAQPKVKPESI